MAKALKRGSAVQDIQGTDTARSKQAAKDRMHGSYPARQGWPTELERAVLRVALLPEPGAAEARLELRRRIARDGFPVAAAPLFPLLFRSWPQDEALTDHAGFESLKAAYVGNFARNATLFSRIQPLLNGLRAEGVRTLLLKGAALATSYYPDLGQRPMSDLDVLVEEERVEDVIRWMETEGWIPAPRRWERFNATYRSVCASHSFSRGEAAIDLHWHVLPEGCRQGDDDAFWEGAVDTTFLGAPASILQPADQLLHTCVHGARRSSVSGVRWVADLAVIVAHSPWPIDWDRLLQQARARRLTVPVMRSLRYVSQHLDAAVPGEVLAACQADPSSLTERLEDNYKRSRGYAAPGGYLPLHWFDFRRWAGFPGYPRSALGFPAYLLRYWGAGTGVEAREVASIAARRMGRRLLSAFGRTHQAG